MLRSISHPHTFEERLAEQKARLKQKAYQLKPGPERDELLKKAEQIDTATHMNEWLNSGLHAPR
jgi:predicted DNA-binding protein (MmcQ/YjbR family)